MENIIIFYIFDAYTNSTCYFNKNVYNNENMNILGKKGQTYFEAKTYDLSSYIRVKLNHYNKKIRTKIYV